jgi:cysteinyl-tRNA synthetase
MEWDSPWGKGFPGWHIECSAMSMKYLGGGERSRTIDIHTGGVDHIPVHHTNEIAQSEAATGKKFVNYWLHAGHLVVEGKKMSKSLGNFLKLEDIQKKGFESLALRYLFLTGHYRSTMNFEWSALEGANQALKKLRSKIPNSKFPACSCLKQQRLAGRQILNKNPKLIDKYQKRFIDYISDDLNMPKVLALVWEVVKSDLTQAEKRVLLLAWDKVLGLDLVREEKIDQEILELVKKRDDLRSERKWQEADKIRIEIETKGYLVEDTNKASVVKKK